MDFSSTEAADDLGGLVRTITESVCTPERQRELDGLDVGAPPGRRPGGRFDSELWSKLKDADISGWDSDFATLAFWNREA